MFISHYVDNLFESNPMRQIGNRSEEINHLVNSFWRAVGDHVDSQTSQESVAEAFEALAKHIQKTQKINLKRAFYQAKRHIKYTVNQNGQVFENRKTLRNASPKIFHMGNYIAHYAEIKNLP